MRHEEFCPCLIAISTMTAHELEPVAERLLNRDLSMAKEWMPHQYVPWSLGRDFVRADRVRISR
jgi:aminoglycoside/choline kinase family phosphotransferase